MLVGIAEDLEEARLITRRFVALGTFAIAVGAQIGCAADATSRIESSDESYTSVANGLWALEGTAEHGDIELLQLAPRNYASIVRETAPVAAQAMEEGAGAGAQGPGRAEAASAQQTSRAAMGNVTRASGTRAAGASAPTLSLSIDDEDLHIAEVGDTLTLTKSDGRILTYRRSYRLYCVPTDRSLEATAILELGKEPKLVGVNGDGHVFPKAGLHAALVRTDVLFRLHDYEIVSDIGASSVIVKLPWSEMSKPEIEGTLAIVGPADAAPPTPISCERVAPSEY